MSADRLEAGDFVRCLYTSNQPDRFPGNEGDVFQIERVRAGGDGLFLVGHAREVSAKRFEYIQRDLPQDGVLWRVVFASGASRTWRVAPDADPARVVSECTGKTGWRVEGDGAILHGYIGTDRVSCLRVD